MKLLDFGMYSMKARSHKVLFSAVNMLPCRKGALCHSECLDFLVIAELRL